MQVFGVTAEPQVTLSIDDAFGQPLPDIAARFKSKQAELTKPAGADAAVWSAHWAGHVNDPGFYRVRIQRPGASGFVHSAAIALVVLEPGSAAPRGEFGWTLTSTDLASRKAIARRLLAESGVGWVKLPLWLDIGDEKVAKETAELVERFEDQGVSVVGVLGQPPHSLREKLHMHGTATALEVFAEHTSDCAATIDPLLVRFGLQIRRWQLGTDGDTSLASYQDTSRLREIAEIFRPLAGDVSLGIACPTDMVMPTGPSAWQFMVIHDQGPPRWLKEAHQIRAPKGQGLNAGSDSRPCRLRPTRGNAHYRSGRSHVGRKAQRRQRRLA